MKHINKIPAGSSKARAASRFSWQVGGSNPSPLIDFKKEKINNPYQFNFTFAIPRAIKRVMNRYGYSQKQCCEMPFSVLVFLHENAKLEEEIKETLNSLDNA